MSLTLSMRRPKAGAKFRSETRSTGKVLVISLALKVLLINSKSHKIHHKKGGKTIKIPLQATFKNMAPSERIEAHIRERAEKLVSFYDKTMGCRVLVEAPHHHHRKGRRYHVRIDVTVPGGEFVIKRAPRLITDRPLRYRKMPDDVEQRAGKRANSLRTMTSYWQFGTLLTRRAVSFRIMPAVDAGF